MTAFSSRFKRQSSPFRQARDLMRRLYSGEHPRSRLFLYAILIFDLTSLLLIIATSFLPRSEFIRWLDLTFGVAFLTEFVMRVTSANYPLREIRRITNWTDLVAIASLLLSPAGEAGAFLRVLRTLRLLRTFRVVQILRKDISAFRRHEEVVFAVTNLAVFIFVMTGVVYETQHSTNAHIRNYADALYFTVTALTTTGFGDITLAGTVGRLITVVIMICGVTLFLNLAKVLFSPTKVRFRCPVCALLRHDIDAVHCKACGTVLQIPDEGAL